MRAVFLTLLVVGAFSATVKHPKCVKRKAKTVEFLLSESNRPENKYKGKETASSIDWGWENGQRWTTWTRNQHIPNYCGACWAMATTSALSDRIMIQSSNAFPEWDLSPQVLLNCDTSDDGCHGGDPATANEYMRVNGITSETCAPYEAVGHDTGETCDGEARCKNCSPGGKCVAQYPHQVWYVTEHGAMSGVNAMVSALQDGPIVCTMAVTKDFEEYEGFGIYNDTSGDTSLDHAISVVGYGTDSTTDTDYWIVRNSWGTWWGYNGYFRIVKGTNNLGIEEACFWATPSTSAVWVNSSSSNITKVKDNRMISHEKHHKTCRPEKNDWSSIQPKIINPLPMDYIDSSTLPTEFRWSSVDGVNYASLARNQHIPTYCGSCWAFGTLSALSDRLSIQRGFNSSESIWPEINLAVQVLINENGGGTCDGGTSPGVMKYIEKHGIPDETCQIYRAKNNPNDGNTDLDICMNCVAGNTSSNFWPGSCTKQVNFTLFGVSEYGAVVGADNMKAEIYARGPISCGVDATPAFENYTGGVFSQNLVFPMINHEISVLGWGVTGDGESYWVGRNSWGTYWGEEGFFKIKMGSDNLAIERDCTWGVPTLKYTPA